MRRPDLTTAHRFVAAPIGATFAGLTDLHRHAAAFPFTTLAVPPGPPTVGDRYEAVTANVVRDVMVLEKLAQTRSGARRAIYRKVDGVFRGLVTLTAVALPRHGRDVTLVTWHYDVVLARGPAWLTAVPATLACALVARLALWKLARQIETESALPY